MTTTGKYEPEKSDINFAVPDERHLHSQDRILGRIIQPGIIDASMNMLENHKDVVLMADCKCLAKGLTGYRMGDVNLWGHEKRPTLNEKLQTFQHNDLSGPVITRCLNMQLITSKISKVREIDNTERKRLLNYEKLNPKPKLQSCSQM